MIDINKSRSSMTIFKEISGKLQEIAESVSHISSDLSKDELFYVKKVLDKNSSDLNRKKREIEKISEVLIAVYDLYKKTEKEIIHSKNHFEQSIEDYGKKQVEVQLMSYDECMEKNYGFSKEESELIKKAYDAFEKNKSYANLTNEEKISLFFSNIAALHSGYSSESKLFKWMGKNPSSKEAIAFFDELGINGKQLSEMINQQHSNTDGYRDFAHECAIYSVMSCNGKLKGTAGIVDNVDDLVGFKGDIYSRSMGMDDVRSDIAAVNIYNRMLECEDGDIFKAFEEYNTDPTINESLEFLVYYGNGDAQKGLKVIEDKINDTSFGTWYLSGFQYGGYGGEKGYGYPNYGYSGYGYSEYGSYTGQESGIDELKEAFLNHLSAESGVPRE